MVSEAEAFVRIRKEGLSVLGYFRGTRKRHWTNFSNVSNANVDISNSEYCETGSHRNRYYTHVEDRLVLIAPSRESRARRGRERERELTSMSLDSCRNDNVM